MTPSSRVFVASVANETNTFSPLRTDLRDFRDGFYAEPGEHPDKPTLCSAVFPAARARARRENWELIEGLATWAEPGGLVKQETWEFLRDEILKQIEAALPLDAVVLGLHGAMVAQDCTDCEGQLLERIRQLVGEDVFVGATFDPHSHMTRKRADNADALVAFKEFPHTDFVETAEHLMEIAARALQNAVKPVISTFDCKMIEILPTSIEPMRSFVDRIKKLEQRPPVLSVSVIHGFMAADVPDIGVKVVVVTDDDAPAGARLAEELGTELFGFRGQTRPRFFAVGDALDHLSGVSAQNGPVVIADVWDNPGGGVPGDSTILLKAMLDRGIGDAALATIWDPIAVRTCISAGAGASLRLRFGGKMSDRAGNPIDGDVQVIHVVRNGVQSFGDSVVSIGDAAVIRIDGIDVILNSHRTQVFNPDIFRNMNIEPSRKKVLVVKSTNHFYDAFAPLASEVVYVAVDGPYPNNPLTNGYTRLTRAVWPLIENPHGCKEAG